MSKRDEMAETYEFITKSDGRKFVSLEGVRAMKADAEAREAQLVGLVRELEIKVHGMVISLERHGQNIDPQFHIEWLNKTLVKARAKLTELNISTEEQT